MSYASDILRPDNRELFETVRAQLNQRNPIVPIDDIADGLNVTVDELCRWVMEFKEPRKSKAYQSPRFPAIPQPRVDTGPDWTRAEDTRRFLAWKKQHDGAKRAREAMSN